MNQHVLDDGLVLKLCKPLYKKTKIKITESYVIFRGDGDQQPLHVFSQALPWK